MHLGPRDFRFQRNSGVKKSLAAMRFSQLAILLTCMVKSYSPQDKMENQTYQEIQFNLNCWNFISSTFGVFGG